MGARESEHLQAGGSAAGPPEGCDYCRAPDPILCEGFCVHCGADVAGARARSAASVDSPAAPVLTPGEIGFAEAARIAWLLLWRGWSLAAAISGAVAFLMYAAGRTGSDIVVSVAAAFLLSFAAALPWLVRHAVGKRFGGFCLAAVREQEGTKWK